MKPFQKRREELKRQHGQVEHHAPRYLQHHRMRIVEDDRVPDKPGASEVEQEADVVMFLYRKGYYFQEENQNIAEVIIAKQRQGPTGNEML